MILYQKVAIVVMILYQKVAIVMILYQKVAIVVMILYQKVATKKFQVHIMQHRIRKLQLKQIRKVSAGCASHHLVLVPQAQCPL